MSMPERATQAELEVLIVHLLGGIVAIVRLGLEAAVAGSTREDEDWQWQGINDLHRICSLPTDFTQAMLDQRLELPEIGSPTHKEDVLAKVREPVLECGLEVVEDILVSSELEVL